MISEEFYRGDQHPVVKNVGELKAQLARLPDDLPIGFLDPVALVVFNHGRDDEHLAFGEAGDYNEDYIDEWGL